MSCPSYVKWANSEWAGRPDSAFEVADESVGAQGSVILALAPAPLRPRLPINYMDTTRDSASPPALGSAGTTPVCKARSSYDSRPQVRSVQCSPPPSGWGRKGAGRCG